MSQPGDNSEARVELTVVEEGGIKAVEGEAGMPFLTGPEDVDRLLEACFAGGPGRR